MKKCLSQLTFLTLLSTVGIFADPISLIEENRLMPSLQAQTVEEKKQQADRLFQEGIQHYRSSQFREAAQSWQEALKLYEEIGDRAGISRSLGNLGNVSERLGKYEEAIDYHQRSLAIDKEMGDRAGIAYSLNNLGFVSERLGNSEEAIDYYQRSLAIKEEIGDRAGISRSLGNLGNVSERLGNYEEAIDYHQRSLAIVEEVGDRAGIASSLNNLGNVSAKLGNYEEAMDYYQRSLAIKEEMGYRAGVSRSLGNLGNVSLNLGNYEEAMDYYQRSLTISKELGDRAGIAYSLGNLGIVSLNLGNYEEAMDYYQRSLAIKEEMGDRAGEARTYNNIAFLLKQQNQPATAIVFYKESVNVYEQIRKDIRGLSPEEQKSYVSTVEYTYRNLADLLLSQGRILEAQQVLELLKVQEITDYTRSGEAGGEEPEEIAANPQETEVLDTHGTLISLGRQIIDCEVNDCDDRTYSQLLDDQEVIADQFQTDIRQLEATIRERRANDEAFLDPSKVTAAASKVVEAQPNSVLIYPLVLEDKLWILWASEGGITSSIEVNTVGEKELSETVLALRQHLQNPNSNLAELQQISKQLYDWLIPPQLATELEQNNIENLVFSLDHVTRYIPIDVLFDGQDYLLKNYTISTILSAELTDLDETQSASPSVLAGGLSDAMPGFNSLPNVPQELDTIVLNQDQDLLGVYAGTIFLNQDFTRNTIRNNLRKHNILHLATHGKFVPGSKYDSYLVLGDGEKYPIPDIQNLRGLDNIDLVVLSACETALGGEGNDGTEIAGISYYFLNNGADAVIASLWQVNDASTRLLMELFYQNLNEGMTKAEALRQAKVSLMTEDEQLASNLSRAGVMVARSGQPVNNQGFEHPYYWSSFILIGNRL